MESVSARNIILEGSVSFNGTDLDTMMAINSHSPHLEDNVTLTPVGKMSEKNGDHIPIVESMTEKSYQTPLRPGNQRHLAAVRLQKTYKSFRTRRRLADCAVLVEQRWWKLLDFAVLKSSSISFFDIERPESAISRWSRARTKAAKVGKGLSKDEKARKLAFQHWLEAIDPRHRYGHNLQFYYVKWLHCNSKQPFFYWLDVGEGREVNLDRCPRLKLHQQCIKYLGPTERKDYEVAVENGNFIYMHTGKLIDTTGGPEDAKWIFVLSVSRTLYVGPKKKGTFQHSSFLAGGATLSAGQLVVENGILKAVWPHSGHYLPTAENFDAFMSFLLAHNVDLSIVQRRSPEHLHPPLRRRARGFSSKLTTLEIPKREDLFEMFKKMEQQSGPKHIPLPMDSSSDEDGYETPEELFSDVDFMFSKSNLFDEGEEEYEETVPKEKIIQRINSHKGMKSYQLAHQLSCKWTTGAGPRIGCMRDYPSELQLRVLEEASLSPRGVFSSPKKTHYNSKAMTPTSLCRETTAGGSPVTPE